MNASRFVKYLLVIFLFNLLVLCFYGRPLIESDGLTYYILTRSLVEDGNLDLNDNKYYPDRRIFFFILNPDKKIIGSLFSGGYALVYAPFMLLCRHLLSLPLLESLNPYYEWPPFIDSLSILLANFLLMNLLMVLVIWSWQHRFSAQKILLALILAFLGTPLVYYTYCSPAFAQFADTFAFSLFFLLSLKTLEKPRAFLLVLAGLAAGLAISIRNINVVSALVFALFIFFSPRYKGWFSAVKRIFWFAAGLLPFALFQALYNYVQYRDCFKTGYFFHRNLAWQSTLWQQLFHPVRGLFIYAPLAGLALGCLFLKRKRHGNYYALSLFAAFFGLAQFFQYWWAGVSFGHRYSVHLYILFAYGLCYGLPDLKAFARPGKKRVFLVILLIAAIYSFCLFNAYVMALSSESSRARLFRNWEKYNVYDIFASAFQAAKEEDALHNCSAKTWYFLNVKHHYPALIFLPFANIHKGHLSFAWGIELQEDSKDRYLDIELYIASAVYQVVYPRLFFYLPNSSGLYYEEQGKLLDVASLDIPLRPGLNRVVYRFYKDFHYDVYVRNQPRRLACRAKVADDFCCKLKNKEFVIHLYLELPNQKYYRLTLPFNLEVLARFFSPCIRPDQPMIGRKKSKK